MIFSCMYIVCFSYIGTNVILTYTCPPYSFPSLSLKVLLSALIGYCFLDSVLESNIQHLAKSALFHVTSYVPASFLFLPM